MRDNQSKAMGKPSVQLKDRTQDKLGGGMQIYVNKDGQQHGPYSYEQLAQYVQAGHYTQDDHACYDGQNWVTITEVPGFAVRRDSLPTFQSPQAALSKFSIFKKYFIRFWIVVSILSLCFFSYIEIEDYNKDVKPLEKFIRAVERSDKSKASFEDFGYITKRFDLYYTLSYDEGETKSWVNQAEELIQDRFFKLFSLLFESFLHLQAIALGIALAIYFAVKFIFKD